MTRPELEATFDLRWGELALGNTVHAADVTLRPAAQTTLSSDAGPRTVPGQLPRISLDYSGASLPPARPAGGRPDGCAGSGVRPV